MDATLCRFLDSVRPRARRTHLATYEDVAAALDSFLRQRRRTAGSLRTGELRSFLAHWYLCHDQLLAGPRARRLCAALLVLVRWLCRDRPPERARLLRQEMRSLARQTTRAARASDLIERLTPVSWGPAEPVAEDGYWEVLLVGDSHVVVRGLEARAPVGPIHLPPAVVRALAPGDILNLLLTRGPQSWHILEIGPCYPPVAAPALRTASLTPA